ncbi:WXG100 family type VII secretion target [Clostridium uliginosum]|uniref:ESAT-6-like protein n=1 Tax=Clostridium uliginosum TaxID=119641 RepID=A0A1I1PTQ9_9CLOT|nr:WXG100 family type VII secretion target [Clostridium uliginosum]SFD10988.1 WXG100 family type VII secretion target [Clostridium uliginosum]
MANQIRISPEQMRSRSGEYKREAENIGQVIGNMDKLINELQNEWEGAASQSFATQYQDLKPSFQKMQELVDTISTQLTQTAAAMEEMDDNISKSFGV